MKANKLLTTMSAIALWVASPLAHAVYMADFQGLTFTFNQTNATTLTFNIAGTPGGDWTGVQYLAAFSLKDLGLNFDPTKPNLATGTADGPGATNLLGLNSELATSSIDCMASGSPPGGICFDIKPDYGPFGAGAIDLTYTIVFSRDLNISSAGPHLKIAFTNVDGGGKVGSLYSQNVGVPEPGTLALVSIGLLGLGLSRSRRKRMSNR